MGIYRNRAVDSATSPTVLDAPLLLPRPQLRRRWRANVDQLWALLLPGRSAGRLRTVEWRQQHPTECGAVSLGIVLRHFGRSVPLADLRRVCGVSRDGSDAANLARAARLFGLEARGFKKGLEALKSVALPAILFWNFDHFLVLEAQERDRYWLNDPATGRRCVDLEEFDRCYTGVVLTLQPGPGFQTSPAPASPARLLCRWIGAGSRLTLLGLTLSVPAVGLLIALLPAPALWPRLWPMLLALMVVALGMQPLAQALSRQLQGRCSRQLQQRLLTLPDWVVNQTFAAELSGRQLQLPVVATFLQQHLWPTLPLVLATLIWGGWLLVQQPSLGMVLWVGAGLLAWITQRSQQADYGRDAQRRLAASRAPLALQGGLEDPETLKASALERDLFLRWAGLDALAGRVRQRLDYSRDLLAWMPQLLGWSLPLLLVGGALLWTPTGMGMAVVLALGFAATHWRSQQLLHHWADCRAALSSLENLAQQAPDPLVLERPAPDLPMGSTPEGRGQGDVSAPPAASLELEEVSFGYVPVQPPLIERLSLRVEPGRRVAIVGGTGSGKSTLVRLMAGLLQPDAGTVRLNGRPLMGWSRPERLRAMAMVQQGLPLLSSTVRDNLCLWDPSISQEQLEQACAAAAILERIQALPQGFDTPLQQGGVRLSGGERQRLQIAQALLQRPSLLILDEATASLDGPTEARVERALRQLPCTQIVVAHRLSTVRDADEILVLEHGRLMQRGSHAELSAQPGSAYHQLLILDDHS